MFPLTSAERYRKLPAWLSIHGQTAHERMAQYIVSLVACERCRLVSQGKILRDTRHVQHSVIERGNATAVPGERERVSIYGVLVL